MKKLLGTICILIGLTIVFSACGGETYADKLKKEKKAIERFLAENNIEVLNVYPEDHNFGENQYYLDPATGVYMQVTDPGGEEKPTKDPRTTIYIKYGSIYNVLDNSELARSNASGVSIYFDYGDPTTYYSSDYTYNAQKYYFMSQALVIPLERGLGKYAEVKLLVPFASGTMYQQNSYEPFFYSKVQYNFTLPVTSED